MEDAAGGYRKSFWGVVQWVPQPKGLWCPMLAARPAEVFAAPRKKTVAPALDPPKRQLQQYSDWDIMKANAFRKSGRSMKEMFEKFGVPEKTLCRCITEDRGRGQLGKLGCPTLVIYHLCEEVKVATENKTILRVSSWAGTRTKSQWKCLGSLCFKELHAKLGFRDASNPNVFVKTRCEAKILPGPLLLHPAKHWHCPVCSTNITRTLGLHGHPTA